MQINDTTKIGYEFVNKMVAINTIIPLYPVFTKNFDISQHVVYDEVSVANNLMTFQAKWNDATVNTFRMEKLIVFNYRYDKYCSVKVQH